MGEENRGSSGGGTMIVVAILGGILVVGCCGGVVALGLGSMLWVRSVPMNATMQPPLAPVPVQATPEVTKALEDLNKDLEPLKIAPDEPGSENPAGASPPETGPPETNALPAAPALEEKKE